MAFYIDKKGRRARPEWMIRWEGQPTAFALNYPYIGVSFFFLANPIL